MGANPVRKGTTNADVIRMTEAEFNASDVIWKADECMSPIDGANAGKHKWGNDVDVFVNLDYQEDGGGGGGATSSDDVSNESGIAGATVTEALDAILVTAGVLESDLAENADDVSNLIAERSQDTYTFSTTTSDSDPGSGNLRFNSGTIGSVTQIFIDDVDAANVNRAAEIAKWGGVLRFQVLYEESGSWTTNNNPIAFLITGVTDASGYTKLSVSYISGTLPTNGQSLKISSVGDERQYLDPKKITVGIVPYTGAGIDPGTIEAKGDYIEGPDVELVGHERPVFWLEGGTTVDRINWNGTQYDLFTADSILYTTNNAPATPQDGVWEVVDGSGPVPTVTQGYSTAQHLIDELDLITDGIQKPYYRQITTSEALHNFDHTLFATLTAGNQTVPDTGSFPIGWELILRNSSASDDDLIFTPTTNVDGALSITVTPGLAITLISRDGAGVWTVAGSNAANKADAATSVQSDAALFMHTYAVTSSSGVATIDASALFATVVQAIVNATTAGVKWTLGGFDGSTVGAVTIEINDTTGSAIGDNNFNITLIGTAA